ncbi:hypothetical protein [Filimonas lacunae]|uniref:hypothetical protein n=1 Tax=Filimonas lacunae TaxID=477680 RepID=UPI000970C442|nr:hypothetical protein [Filimonas lacunae]
MKGNIRLTVWVAVIAILVSYCICKMLHRQVTSPPKAHMPVADSVRQVGFNIHRLLIKFT